MNRVVRLFSAAVVALCALAPLQQPARADPELTDSAIDEIMFSDRHGAVGLGDATRGVARFEPELFEEMRGLIRNAVRAKPDEKPAALSALIDFNGRFMDRISLGLRRAPPDALDGMIHNIQPLLREIEAADPKLCGYYAGWAGETASLELRQARIDISTRADVAIYRAFVAARERPTTYPPYDEAMADKTRAAMKAAGVGDEQSEAILVTGKPKESQPSVICDLERRYVEALASLPGDVRGAVLAFFFSGDDGSGQ